MKEEILIVEDISCNHCVEKIQRFVSELAGVNSVNIDLQTKNVHVICEDTVKVEDIKEAILDAGFNVT